MNYYSSKSYCEDWKEASMKDFHKLFFCSVLQVLNLENMFEQTEVYHLMHYVVNYENEIIIYASKKSASHNYLVNVNHAESE